MNRPLTITALTAILVGLLVGFLWWGLPYRRLQGELRGAQASADRTRQQLDELRAQRERLEAQVKSETSQREALESDLRREKEQSARLHMLISKGKK